MHDSFEPFSLIVLFECTSLVKRLRLVLHETPLPHVTILNLGWLEQGTTTSYSSHLKRHERKTASSLWLNQIRISLIFESILIKYCFLSSTTVIWLNHLPFYPIRLILQTNNSQSCTILLLLAAFCIFICFSVNYSMYVVYFFCFSSFYFFMILLLRFPNYVLVVVAVLDGKRLPIIGRTSAHDSRLLQRPTAVKEGWTMTSSFAISTRKHFKKEGLCFSVWMKCLPGNDEAEIESISFWKITSTCFIYSIGIFNHVNQLHFDCSDVEFS